MSGRMDHFWSRISLGKAEATGWLHKVVGHVDHPWYRTSLKQIESSAWLYEASSFTGYASITPFSQI